jgi:hypothetical protein
MFRSQRLAVLNGRALCTPLLHSPMMQKGPLGETGGEFQVFIDCGPSARRGPRRDAARSAAPASSRRVSERRA